MEKAEALQGCFHCFIFQSTRDKARKRRGEESIQLHRNEQRHREGENFYIRVTMWACKSVLEELRRRNGLNA